MWLQNAMLSVKACNSKVDDWCIFVDVRIRTSLFPALDGTPSHAPEIERHFYRQRLGMNTILLASELYERYLPAVLARNS
jgi:hypothetical protein